MIADSIASNLQKSMWELWKRCRENGLRNPFLVTILIITQAQERNLKTKCEDISSLLEAAELEFGSCGDDVHFFLGEFCDQWLNGGLHCELAFETALDLGMQAGNSVGMVSSSKSMAAVMATAAMAGVKEFSKSPRIWDPCCGSARGIVELALRLIDSGLKPRLLGWETNAVSAAVARANLFVHNLDGEIVQIDTLQSLDKAPFREFDFVVTEPPMGMRWVSQRDPIRYTGSIALPWGLPPASDATWVFAQLAFNALKPARASKAIIATGRGPLVSTIARPIRLEALKQEAFTAITLLPNGTSSVTNSERFLLSLTSDIHENGERQVTIVDARELFSTGGRLSGSSRQITDLGMELITQALKDKRPTRISRTVTSRELSKTEVRIEFKRLEQDKITPSISHWLPQNSDVKQWFYNRYGKTTEVALNEARVPDVNLTGQWLFETSSDSKEKNQAVPISMIVSSIKIPYREGNRSLDETRRGTVEDVPWIVITRNTAELQDSEPQSLIQDKSAMQESTDWNLAFQVTGELSPEYVVLFLNSENGLAQFRSNLKVPFRVFSLRDGLSQLDSMLIPNLNPKNQIELVSATSSINAIRTRLADDEMALWSGSLEIRDFTSRADTYLGLDPIMIRLQSWPNPIASVAWMVETASETPSDKERAINRFWEAVTGFHSTILLSALKGMPDLETPTLDDIRRGVSGNGHLRFEEASTGLFSLFTTTCMRKIRNEILESSNLPSEDSSSRSPQSDSDDSGRNDRIEQIIAAFGGLPINLINRLVSKDLARIFERSRPLRTVGAHDGAESRDAQAQRVDEMYSLIQEWDIQTRPIWSSYQLVRAGASHRNKAKGYYEQQIEIMVGNNYPFATSKVKVVDAYGSGDVYIHCNSAQYGLELTSPLFEFQEWPEESRIACYFYNRDNGETMDLKSFIALPQSNISRTSEQISNTLHWLKGN